ncbi:MAG: molecular chaperone DjlA [Bacteroidota bacterium]|nr:molecular chaperone DjlA [Bacteroidota bacterium]
MPGKFSFNNLFDSISKLISEEDAFEKKQTKNPLQKSHDDEIQNAILVLAADVVRFNIYYTGDTEKFIQEFLVKQFGAVGVKRKMNLVSEHLDIGTEPLTKISCKELKMLTTHDSRMAIIGFLFGVAGTDDFINAKETRCIHRIATYLGISDKDFKELRHSFVSENNPYKVLGIEEGANFEQVRAAHRKMILKFHPDKRESHISEAEASLKFREIQRAFEIIKEQLG